MLLYSTLHDPLPPGSQISLLMRNGERVPISQISRLADSSRPIVIVKTVVGKGYERTIVSVTANRQALDLAGVQMIDENVKDAYVEGICAGSPIVTSSTYMSIEHPMAENSVKNGHASSLLRRSLPLQPGQTWTISSVVGHASKRQLRRAFLAYLEENRARPYGTLLHYNSWYDIGYFSKYSQEDALRIIQTYGNELVRKRGAKMDSFLFDDGWDEPATLWSFHSGFPNGFAPIKEAAESIGAEPGVWLSPWGGYGDPRKQRLEFGRKQGYETNEGGFALSGPVYYKRFKEVTSDFVTKFGVNQFKFDGTGNASTVIPGSEFSSDFEAMMALIEHLRALNKNLFVNLTTGTWPSPFWTRYADSIWRGGWDHDFLGVGTDRQKWITYKDGDTYQGIVKRGPLYPLNSLMIHGIIFAKHAHHLNTDPKDDLKDEIHAAFGNGSQLQELYVSPELLSARNWDDLAEAAKWSRANAGVLKDTHWIGGDPAKLDVYGWAAWSPHKAIVTLRNPSDAPQAFSLDPTTIFELPAGQDHNWAFNSPWIDEKSSPPLMINKGRSKVIVMKPFEVRNMEATW